MIMKDLTEKDPRTYAIIGAAMEVHRQLGCGFLEPVYQEALALEFSKRGIPFRREVTLPIYYNGVRLNTPYRVDFICFEEVAVELKLWRDSVEPKKRNCSITSKPAATK